MRAKLSIGADGEVVLPPATAEALGVAPGDEVDLVSARGAFLLLAPAVGSASPRAALAGSLAALTVPEVVQFLFTTLKTGILLLAFGDEAERATAPREGPERIRRKTISFRDGQVVFASSSDPADRLGAVLWRHDLLSLADLERCSRLVRSGRPLGQILIDEGIVDSGQLYAGVALQVREILLNAFLEGVGEFAFLEGPHDDTNAVKLPERTRELLLEGMKRTDEADRLASELGGRAAVLSPTGATARALSEQEARLLEFLDGTRALDAAASASGVGLFYALRFASVLRSEGLITGGFDERIGESSAEPVAPEVPPTPPPSPGAGPPISAQRAADPFASGPFETYRRIFRRVFSVLAAAQPDARARLNSYFDRLPERARPVFEGVRIDGEGEVDVAQVLLNVNATGAFKGAAARARSLEALEDFLAFALFELKNVLPRERAEAVLREVGRMQVGKG
jgi:hypothetical protein